MIFNLSYHMTLAFNAPVRNHQFMLRLLPRLASGVVVQSQQLMITGEHDAGRFYDGFANRLICGQAIEAHRDFHVSYQAKLSRSPASLTEQSMMTAVYLAPSKLTLCDAKRLSAWLELPSVYDNSLQLAQALSHLVYQRMTYSTGATHTEHTVSELVDNPVGVCQDYAHLLIALLRYYLIPARYVAGIAQGEGQSHAWVEAWIDGYWLGLDPTHDCLVHEDDPYIAFAVGRDFSDCPLNSGAFSGNATHTLTIQANLTPSS
jgi:transglutaminase-like putative cysteine protease